jgi:hypothetical protein
MIADSIEFGEFGTLLNRTGQSERLTDVIWLLKSVIVGIRDLKTVIP